MTTGSTTFDPQRYEALRQAGQQAARDGAIEKARELLQQAWELASDSGDPVLVDRAFCNLAAVEIECQPRPDDQLLPRLRDILVRNNDLENCRLAAYSLARAYEARDEHKKGLFYARIAFERTSAMPNPDRDWLASSHNQVGNFLVTESRFEEALQRYEDALELQPESEFRWALIENNIGYCHLMLNRFGQAFRMLHRSLRVLRRLNRPKDQLLVHLDLCLAHLEVGRNRHALRHGTRALALAEQWGSPDDLKKALYLLGEATNMLGDEAAARKLFDRLQEHYPETPFLADFLLAIDVRKVINLRA